VVVVVIEGSGSNRPTSDRDTGWEPDRRNPNLQRYWDGSDWTAARRWVSGQWVDESLVPTRPASMLETAGSTVQASSSGTTKRARQTVTVTAGFGGLFICGVLLILGSVTPWVTVSFVNQSTSVQGTDITISHTFLVNGWFTLPIGILLLLLTFLGVTSGERVIRGTLLLLSLAGAAVAVYALVRILQLISQSSAPTFNGVPIKLPVQPNASVGWGLIVLLIGAVGAVLCALSEVKPT
jgi:uncharacterized membrane protein